MNIDARVENVIKNGGARSGETDSERSEEEGNCAGPGRNGEKHADDGGEDDKYHHTRFGLLIEVPPLGQRFNVCAHSETL